MATQVATPGLKITLETPQLLVLSCTRLPILSTTQVCISLQPHSHPLNFVPAFDIHEYLDVDFSGSHSVCAQAAATNLAPLTSWLQQYGFKAMITEFGGANGTQCDSYITDMVNYMADNDVYIGWTAWAAGPLWGTYSACCADSQQWGSLEPGSLAADGSPGMYMTVWLDEIEPLLPKTLVTSGISSLNH